MTWYDTVPWGNQPVIWLQVGNIWPFPLWKGQLIVIAGIDKYFVWICLFFLSVSSSNTIQELKEWEIYCHGILYNFFLIESIKGPVLRWRKGDKKCMAMRYHSFYYILHYPKSAGLIQCWILSCVSSRHKKTTSLWMTLLLCGLGVYPLRDNGSCVMPCL